MGGLKTRNIRISVICPICKNKVQKKNIKKHQRGNLCSLQNKKFEIPVIPGPDFVRKQLEKRRLIEHYRENRKYEKRNNDMGNVSHVGYHDGSITITGGRDDTGSEKVICPICKRECMKRHLSRHQKSKVCSLFKEKETICS